MLQQLNRTFLHVGVAIAAFVTLAFLVFMVNQTAAVVQLASGISPAFGTATLWGLLVAYSVLIATPVVLFLRLPEPLRPPAEADTEEQERYLLELGKRLKRNPRLRGESLETPDQIGAGVAKLGDEADEVVKATAASVFVSTAISQYGRLDGFLVLGAQSRMVWQVAHVYHQRPTLRDMVRLYANVGSTVFIASELDDVDVAEQVEPMISGVLGSLTTAIPGVQNVAGLIVNSALTGSANAFLTLRVGMIAKRYSAALVREEKRSLKRAATAEAAGLLRSIASTGTRTVAVAMYEASKGRFQRVFDSAWGGVIGAGETFLGKGTSLASKVIPGRRSDREPVGGGPPGPATPGG